jgi:hypothetical protein
MSLRRNSVVNLNDRDIHLPDQWLRRWHRGIRPGTQPTLLAAVSTARNARTGDEAADAFYSERRCALRWPLVVWGLGLPIGLIAVLSLAVTLSDASSLLSAWAVPIVEGLGFVAAMVRTALLYRNCPPRIRLDEQGVSIGAVGSRRSPTRRPTVTH